MKGKVTVPSRVQEHFLAYINPREAAMLRAMGGGVSKDGGQKMMNGVPFFSEADEEGGPGFDVADVTGPSTSGGGPTGFEISPLDDLTPDKSTPAFEPYDVPAPDLPPTEPYDATPEAPPLFEPYDAPPPSGIMSLVKDYANKGVGGMIGDYLGLSPQSSGALQAGLGLASIGMGGLGLVSGGYGLFQGLNRALDLDVDETDPFETDEREMGAGSDR
jgi:hypothetical protein